MEPVKRIPVLLFLFCIPLFGFAQLKPVYPLQVDDTLLRKNYYDQAAAQQKNLLNSLGKEYKDDYKSIYKDRFEQISALLRGRRTVTSPEAHQYLQAILKKITEANPELAKLTLRVVFSRDGWPNAYSLGEGTIAINAGLMIFLENESELVFALCHELAHLYLDHSNAAIQKTVELINSESFKAEMKKLSRQEYGAGAALDKLMKGYAFGSRRHSRDNEAAADNQGFLFMKKTGYDCGGIKTCLQLLDKVDDSTVYPALDLQRAFKFEEYPFRQRWTQKESVIFGQMNENDSPLSKEEKDSLKTHPDCAMRIRLLEDSISRTKPGSKFGVNEKLFQQLKKDFFVEMTEQEFRDKNYTRNLYYSLQQLQNGANIPFAVYSTARALNSLYEHQKNHRLGTVTEKESRVYRSDYNLLLRMIDRLKLEEIANLNYYFCRQYLSQMTGYEGFEKEWNQAARNKSEY